MDPNSKQTAQNDSTEQSGASDIDSLLSEYDSGTKSVATKKESTAEPGGEMNEVLSYIRQTQQRETESAINETVKAVKGDLNIGDDVVRGFIEVQASKSKAIQEAFANRVADPDSWSKYQKQLMNDFKGQFPSIDEKATSDTNDLLAAVQSSKQSESSSDEIIDFVAMDDSEFQKQLNNLR